MLDRTPVRHDMVRMTPNITTWRIYGLASAYSVRALRVGQYVDQSSIRGLEKFCEDIQLISQTSNQFFFYSGLTNTRKLCAVAKMTARCALYMGALNFRDSHDYTHGYYSQHCSWYFVPINPMNIPTKFEVRSLPVPEIIGGTQKIRAVPGYAHAPFFPKFLTGFYSDWPCKYVPTKFEVRSFTRS